MSKAPTVFSRTRVEQFNGIPEPCMSVRKTSVVCEIYRERSSVSLSSIKLLGKNNCEQRSKLLASAHLLSYSILAIAQKSLVSTEPLEWKLFKNILKSLPGFLVVNIRKCQLIDASGVLSTPLASSHTSFSLLFGCKREVKYTNSVPLVIFFRCSLLDTSGNCQKRDWSGCLMDYFPAELIAQGVRH